MACAKPAHFLFFRKEPYLYLWLIGLDIGGTKCAVSIGRKEVDRLTLLDKRVIKTAGEPDVMLPQILDAAHELLTAHRNPAIAGAGISCGRLLGIGRGLILSPPNLPVWKKVPVVETVRAALGVPTYLCNDADACALAEWRYGAGRSTQNKIFLTFGTGLVAGLILNRPLYSDSCGMAREIGHVRLGISTSGNAANICAAFTAAKARGMLCIALTGSRDSHMSALADITVRAPAILTPVVQQYHLPLYHALCAEVEKRFFAE